MPTSPSDSPTRDRGPDEVFCRNCGEVIDQRAEICPSCGVRQRPAPKSSVDSAVETLLEGGNPFVAALLSAIFPGLGQIYNRELERGLVLVVATIFAAFSTLVFVGFILFPAVWLFAIYDAYTRAELRAAQLRETEADVPESMSDADAPVSLNVEADDSTDEVEPGDANPDETALDESEAVEREDDDSTA